MTRTAWRAASLCVLGLELVLPARRVPVVVILSSRLAAGRNAGLRLGGGSRLEAAGLPVALRRRFGLRSIDRAGGITGRGLFHGRGGGRRAIDAPAFDRRLLLRPASQCAGEDEADHQAPEQPFTLFGRKHSIPPRSVQFLRFIPRCHGVAGPPGITTVTIESAPDGREIRNPEFDAALAQNRAFNAGRPDFLRRLALRQC